MISRIVLRKRLIRGFRHRQTPLCPLFSGRTLPITADMVVCGQCYSLIRRLWSCYLEILSLTVHVHPTTPPCPPFTSGNRRTADAVVCGALSIISINPFVSEFAASPATAEQRTWWGPFIRFHLSTGPIYSFFQVSSSRHCQSVKDERIRLESIRRVRSTLGSLVHSCWHNARNPR